MKGFIFKIECGLFQSHIQDGNKTVNENLEAKYIKMIWGSYSKIQTLLFCLAFHPQQNDREEKQQ